MSLTEARSRLTPEFRTTAFYFTFFMGPGAAVMFLPIWLSEKASGIDMPINARISTTVCIQLWRAERKCPKP